jgi:hypothetical protein
MFKSASRFNNDVNREMNNAMHVSPVSTPVEFSSVSNSASLSLFADVWDHTPPPAVLVSVPHVGPGLLDGGADACCEVVGTGGRDMGLYPNKFSE